MPQRATGRSPRQPQPVSPALDARTKLGAPGKNFRATLRASSHRPQTFAGCRPLPPGQGTRFFGRLEDRKGLVLFCDALDLLKDDPQLRHASLAFLGKADKIGNRDSADYLADRAKSWPWKWQLISDRDQVGAMDYLQGTSRLAVLPSLVDNLPNTVLE